MRSDSIPHGARSPADASANPVSERSAPRLSVGRRAAGLEPEDAPGLAAELLFQHQDAIARGVGARDRLRAALDLDHGLRRNADTAALADAPRHDRDRRTPARRDLLIARE